jgi:hypothetical protein
MTASPSSKNFPTVRGTAARFALIFSLIASSLGANSAFAAKYSNAFTAFELPPGWSCNQEGAEFVCQNSNDLKKKDSIIVLAAKTATPTDTIDAYRLFLKSAKTWTGPQGKAVKSEPRSDKTINVGGTMWIDALHLESEIPGFYTRYLATVKHDIGVLVALSVASSKFKEYTADFDAIAQSIQVFKKPEAVTPPPAQPGGGMISGPNITLLPDSSGPGQISLPQQTAPAPSTGKGQKGAAAGEGLLLLLVLGGAVVGFLILKKRKQG